MDKGPRMGKIECDSDLRRQRVCGECGFMHPFAAGDEPKSLWMYAQQCSRSGGSRPTRFGDFDEAEAIRKKSRHLGETLRPGMVLPQCAEKAAC
jgi:hypothetical protein